MKYQLVPDNPMEEKALKASPAAKPLFDPFLPPIQARSIMAGVRLGIFKAIGQRSLSADELAKELSLDAECLKLLLRVLACAGYVSPKGNLFQLTELSRMTLLPDSPMQLSGWVEYNYVHWNVIDKLEQVLKTGKGIGLQKTIGDPANWAIQQKAMLETARPAAPVVASLVPVKDSAKRMLDIALKSARCVGCGVCVGRCEAGALSVDGVVKLDEEKCVHCGKCLGRCPAVDFSEEFRF